MNFYEAVVRFKQQEGPLENKTSVFPDANEQNEKKWLREVFAEVNNKLGVRCDAKEAFCIFVCESEIGEIKIIFSVNIDISDLEGAKQYIKEFFEDNYAVCAVEILNVSEITTKRFHQLGMCGDNNGLIRRFRNEEGDMEIDYRENAQYQIREDIIPDEIISFEEAVKQSKKIMADDSFIEEIERIYSSENEKKYYGNPVHYKISASNMEAAVEMTKLLGHALKSNCRLAGSRINRIYEIKEGCYNEDDFRHMFEYAQGNIVLLDLSGSAEEHGNYASAYETVIEYMCGVINKNQIKTLCIFLENTEHPGFASKLLAKLAEDLDIIEINEGNGSRDTAVSYIENLAKKDNYGFTKEEIEKYIPDKQLFTIGEVYEIYNRCFKNGLKNKIYKSYQNCTCMDIRKEDKKSAPYDELQKMIGLKEIKKTVDEVIDSARIQKLRSDMGMDSYKPSLHMVFTGNPGTAKTTVARLITQIFLKEGILETGKYVECGRADLVGRYVGWTAKTVRTKFREAKGGVLFIDEAYSLVDDSNSFGDEAINTIVQEMENHRDDVIVVFAGYPEKMKDFLAKNEGLRSRIAFHMDFPDYNSEELLEILKLMADKKGYKIDRRIEEKCRAIFEKACQREEFGNGRYARNLLEQAMMAQAGRIMREFKGKKVNRKALVTLKAEDFEVNASKQMEKKRNPIGFAV